MCDYRGGFEESSKLIPDTDPSCIPQNCEAIIYTRFSIDMKQRINVDYGKLFVIMLRIIKIKISNIS